MAMVSSVGEQVKLKAPVRITDDVENWLGDLAKEMRETLDDLLKKTLQSKGGMDIVNTPSQICCLTEMVLFSDNCNQAIKKGKLGNFKQDL